MLTFAPTPEGRNVELRGDAHIVISLDVTRAGISVVAFCLGRLDSSYAPLPKERIPEEVGKLLCELRAQLSAAGICTAEGSEQAIEARAL